MRREEKSNGIGLLIGVGAVGLFVLVGHMVATSPDSANTPKAQMAKPLAAPAPKPKEVKPVAAPDAQQQYATARKDLLWTIDDPDMGYLDVLESKSQANNPDIYSQTQEEIWHFVENNYGNLPVNLKQELKFEGLKHLDCRMKRACPVAPKFVVEE